jgi:hypothetical protein
MITWQNLKTLINKVDGRIRGGVVRYINSMVLASSSTWHDFIISVLTVEAYMLAH